MAEAGRTNHDKQSIVSFHQVEIFRDHLLVSQLGRRVKLDLAKITAVTHHERLTISTAGQDYRLHLIFRNNQARLYEALCHHVPAARAAHEAQQIAPLRRRTLAVTDIVDMELVGVPRTYRGIARIVFTLDMWLADGEIIKISPNGAGYPSDYAEDEEKQILTELLAQLQHHYKSKF